MFGRVLALIAKEFQAILRDPKSRAVLIGPPLIQLLVFGFAATQEVKNVTIGVVDKDLGRWSHEVTARFRGSPTFSEVLNYRSLAEGRAALDSQRTLLLVHFDQNFSRDLEAGRAAAAQVILDGRRSNASQIVNGYVARIIQSVNAEAGAQPASDLVVRHWFNPNLEQRWSMAASLVGVLTMVISVILTALSIARERELGTWDQLLVSPLTPGEILFGKCAPPLLISMFEGLVIVILGVLLLGAPFRGAFPLLLFSIPVFAAGTVGIGLFVSALCATQQQAILGAFTIMVPAILLSGFMTPVENMPQWLQPATEIIPLKHFLIIVKGVFLKDMPFSEVLANTWPMAAIAAATLPGAAWFFRRSLG